MSDKDYSGPERRELRAEPWHFKKEVSVGHIVTTVGWVILAIWWASQTDARLSALEARSDKFEAGFSEVPERLARIETTLINIADRLDRESR